MGWMTDLETAQLASQTSALPLSYTQHKMVDRVGTDPTLLRCKRNVLSFITNGPYKFAERTTIAYKDVFTPYGVEPYFTEVTTIYTSK